MNRRRIIIAACAFVFLILTFSIALSTTDPLITESYLRDVFFKEVKEYIAEQANKNESQVFKVVSVPKNKTFIGNAGCEIILRQGQGKVIASNLGGLSDVTAGYDLADNSMLPPNHLLIIPRDDNRGFLATADVLVMVKGGYEIK